MNLLKNRREFLCGCSRYGSVLGGTLLFGCGGGSGGDRGGVEPGLLQDPPSPQAPVASAYAQSDGINTSADVAAANVGTTYDYACAGASGSASNGACEDTYRERFSDTDDTAVNQFFEANSASLREFFLSPATVSFFDECGSANALSLKATSDVLFGLKMLNEVRAQFSDPSSPLLFILAHEFTHQLQFKFGWYEKLNGDTSVRAPELVADLLGAFYMFTSYPDYYASQQDQIFNILVKAFSLGDANWRDPGHHGTQKQRAQAVVFGAQLANEVGSGQVAYDWASIHSRAWDLVVFTVNQPEYMKEGPAKYYKGRVV